MSIPLPPQTRYLEDWFVRYTKNRDLTFRKITEIKEDDNKVIVNHKDGKKQEFIIEPFPAEFSKTAETIKEEHKGIVVYNTQKNFDMLTSEWKKLSAIKNLAIYFVNPFSKTEKRWIINPYTHSLVSDASSLKQGLSAMFVMVDAITQDEVAELTK
jgi:hypothetical protein